MKGRGEPAFFFGEYAEFVSCMIREFHSLFQWLRVNSAHSYRVDYFMLGNWWLMAKILVGRNALSFKSD